MNTERYICPKCKGDMYWTGNVNQNFKGKCLADLQYHYRCMNPSCNYEEKYERLDDHTIRLENSMITALL